MVLIVIHCVAHTLVRLLGMRKHPLQESSSPGLFSVDTEFESTIEVATAKIGPQPLKEQLLILYVLV